MRDWYPPPTRRCSLQLGSQCPARDDPSRGSAVLRGLLARAKVVTSSHEDSLCCTRLAQSKVIPWVILTGGESRRMGDDKAAMVVAGTSLRDRAIAAVGEHRIVGPEVRGGPAHALVTFARQNRDEAFGVLAVDMPFAARVVLDLAQTWSTCSADALIAHDERPQWLCGVYRRTAVLAAAGNLVNTENLAMWRIGEHLRVEHLEVTDKVSLFDVDTPADLEWATRHIRGESPDPQPHRV